MVANQSTYKQQSTYLTHKRREARNQPPFWMRFSAARRSAGISQIQLAMELGVSRPTIIAWEHSERIPRPYLGRKVIRYLWSLVPEDERDERRKQVESSYDRDEPSVWQLKRAIGFAPQFDRTGSSIGANSSTALVKPDRESWVEF